MSHVKTQTTSIVDLTCLETAGGHRNMAFDRAATQFKYYGGAMNPCQGKLSVIGNEDAYELGVEKNSDGTYNLLYDPYQGGKGLMKAIGENATGIIDEYNAAVSMKTLSMQGMRCRRSVQSDGSVMVVAE